MNRLQTLLATFICLLLLTTNAKAQSWQDLFNKDNISNIVNSLTGNNKINLVGTWTYQGSAIELKSDDLIKKAGGTLAAATVEQNLDKQLNRVGVKAGITNFTFKEDSTFTSTIGKRTLSGKYSYDTETKLVALKYAGLVGINAKVNQASNSMSLLFDADVLLKLLVYFGNKSTSSSLKTITALAQGYDGMMMGLDLNRKP